MRGVAHGSWFVVVAVAAGCSLLEDPSQFVGDGGPSDAPLDVIESSSDAPPPPPSGTILWARSASTAFLYGVAQGSGGVVVSGVLSGPGDLGGGVIVPSGAEDAVLAQYAPSDGSYLFSSRFGGGMPTGSGQVYAYLDLLDISGVPIVSGQSTCNSVLIPQCNTIDIGLGQLPNAGTANADGFVGRYPVNNAKPTWVDRLSGAGMDTLVWVANGPTETFFVTGWYDQSTSFIDSTKKSPLTNLGDRDVFLASVNPETGVSNFVTSYADPAFEQPVTIAWTGTDIIMSGFVAGVDVTGFGLPKRTTQGFDWFVAKLAPNGTPTWWVVLGGAGDDKYPNMVLDAAGDIYLAGTIDGSATFGTFPVGGAGGTDIAVAKLKNADGSVVWAKSFGSTTDDTVAGITMNASEQILVSAVVSGPIAPNGPWNGDLDAALVSYDKTGNVRWSKVLGTSGSDFAGTVTSGSDGFYTNVNFGTDVGPTIEGVPIQGAPQPTGVVLKIQP